MKNKRLGIIGLIFIFIFIFAPSQAVKREATSEPETIEGYGRIIQEEAFRHKPEENSFVRYTLQKGDVVRFLEILVGTDGEYWLKVEFDEGKQGYIHADSVSEMRSSEVRAYLEETDVMDKLKNANVGDYILFGAYEQDNNASNGKEKIEWQVLEKEPGKMLVISHYALDAKQYNTVNENVTWENCSLRNWLNSTFVDNAFDFTERNKIVETVVYAERNSKYVTISGNNTTDKVFLLSIEEAAKYFFSDIESQCHGTEYCFSQGVYKIGKDCCNWWLRTRGFSDNTAALVYGMSGDISSWGENVDSIFGIRPALWINIES